MTETYVKTFTRDFSLIMLEIWYKAEAQTAKPWCNSIQEFLPYIIFQRKNGTVSSYYSSKGMDWIKIEILKKINSNPEEIEILIKNVEEKLKPIINIYENKKVLSKTNLIKFIQNYDEAYPWIETLWWLCHLSDEGKIDEVKVDELIKLRSKTEKLSSGTDMVARKSLESIFPDYEEYIQVISYEEFISENIPNIEILKKRDNSFVLTDNKLFLDKTLKAVEDLYGISIKKEIFENLSEIKGQSGFPGKVEGKVRKIMGYKDVTSLQEGEILVSPMTLPDFLPAIKKAAAIVTDEGGITCHAAIISREMKKPCVIGTKIATKIFKDGDLIEVDADNGIVRILN